RVAASRGVGQRGGARRVLPPAARELQEARDLPCSPRAAEEPDGEDPSAGASPVVTRSTRSAVVVRVDDGVARVTLARPETGNRLDLPLCQALTEACAAVADDAAAHVVVLEATGRAFSVGL